MECIDGAALRWIAASLNSLQGRSVRTAAPDLIAPLLGLVGMAAIDREGGPRSFESWRRLDAKRDGDSMGGATNSPCFAVQERVDLLRTETVLFGPVGDADAVVEEPLLGLLKRPGRR